MITKVKTLKFNRKNMLKFANELYNEKTGEYTKMCNGKLTNPDGIECKITHCGLGELYFRFEGKHAFSDYIPEDEDGRKLYKNSVQIDEDGIAEHFSYCYPRKVSDPDLAFEILSRIPDGNDKSSDYKSRAKRVASEIRAFAKLIKE